MEENKQKKRNIIMMLILALAFIVGILTRWDETKNAVTESINNYFEIDKK